MCPCQTPHLALAAWMSPPSTTPSAIARSTARSSVRRCCSVLAELERSRRQMCAARGLLLIHQAATYVSLEHFRAQEPPRRSLREIGGKNDEVGPLPWGNLALL